MKALPKRRTTIQIDTQVALDLLEETGKICTWDLEASGLNGDYNSIVVASVKGFGKKVKTFTAKKIGDDKQLVADLAAELESYEAWISFYGKGFDLKMLRSKLLLYKMEDIELKPHIDMFYVLKFATNTARRSQAHYLRWLEIHQQKMDLSPDVWAKMAADPKKHMKTLVARCESDTAGLEALYSRTRHVIKDMKR